MALGGATLGVITSEQTNLHTDSLPNALNTNKSVPANNYIAFLDPTLFFLIAGKKLLKRSYLKYTGLIDMMLSAVAWRKKITLYLKTQK